MRNSPILCGAALFAVSIAAPALSLAQTSTDASTGATTTSTVTSVTGTISQLNYDSNGTVDGFLVGTNVLLSFRENVTGGVASLGAVGNSVTYSGNATTTSSGFENVSVTSFTNNTTKATYTSTTTTPASTAYGPTSGTVKQLNYGANGSINGFVFTPSGSSTSLFVETGPAASSTLQPLLTVGGTVSVTGTTPPAQTNVTCTVTGALGIVNATSLTINGQTIVIAGGGGFGGGRGPGGPGGFH